LSKAAHRLQAEPAQAAEVKDAVSPGDNIRWRENSRNLRTATDPPLAAAKRLESASDAVAFEAPNTPASIFP